METLFFRSMGGGEPVIILHGLFGSSRNWHTVARVLSADFRIFLVDQRNHGRSFHSNTHSYDDLSADFLRFLDQNKLEQVFLIGHSMGGKAAMTVALSSPERVRKIVVVDIAPRAYPPGHDHLLEALTSLNLREIKSREEANTVLKKKIPDVRTRQFLLTNLTRGEDGGFQWRMNLSGLKKNYQETTRAIRTDRSFAGPALFVRGEHSGYIDTSDLPLIKRLFPRANVVTVHGAGHWVHADAPSEFVHIVRSFLRTPPEVQL